MKNEIQFTAEDIVRKLEAINDTDPASRRIELGFLGHELRGPHTCLVGYANLLSDDDQLTPIQRIYISRIEKISDSLIQTVSEMTSQALDKYTPDFKGILNNQSKSIVKGIEDLVMNMPVKENVTSIRELPCTEKEYLDMINMAIENTVYMNNLHFSPEFQREEYQLDKDVKRYVRQQYIETKTTAAIEEPDIHNIITKFDYLKNAIIPIIKNVNDHAYNCDNHHAKHAEKDAPKKINISSIDDKEKKCFIIAIADNGFGIDPRVEDRMFEEGVSSRKDASGHGIGLCSVKKHVEDNGGKMWFDSNPGQGTIFYFTIPYDREDNGRYFSQG